MGVSLNTIQLITGILAIAAIFAGLFITVRGLSKEDPSVKLSRKRIITATVLIASGLLFYAVTKTCTNLSGTNAEYDPLAVYFASLIDVIKYFGFILLIPILFNYLKKKPGKKETVSDD